MTQATYGVPLNTSSFTIIDDILITKKSDLAQPWE